MPQVNSDIPVKPQINPAALAPEMAAKVLGLTSEIINKHITEGAPVAADGTINLINYAAWVCLKLREDSG